MTTNQHRYTMSLLANLNARRHQFSLKSAENSTLAAGGSTTAKEEEYAEDISNPKGILPLQILITREISRDVLEDVLDIGSPAKSSSRSRSQDFLDFEDQSVRNQQQQQQQEQEQQEQQLHHHQRRPSHPYSDLRKGGSSIELKDIPGWDNSNTSLPYEV
jgi:hypothetical protein